MSHNKLRTALTGLSVAWGIFMLITLVSVASGITSGFKENMASQSSQKMMLWSGVTTKPYHGYREGRSIQLKPADMTTLEAEHPEQVKQATAVISGQVTNFTAGANSVSTFYQGVKPVEEELSNIKINRGRFINDNDMARKTKVMVLPDDYARQLFPPDGEKAVGSRVNVGDISFIVVGKYNGKWMRNVYIPYTTAQALSEDQEYIGSMTLVLKNVDNTEQADRLEKGVRKSMAKAHDFSPEDESGVWIWNAISQSLTARTGINILNIGVWVLGLLTLLSGIIGISNIMFVSVRERTHEIGIRRAIGAKPHKILTQILAESIAITTLFGYIGILLGVALTELLTRLFGEFIPDARVDLSIAAQVTVVLIIAGALAGLFPALKALKVKPVEALRDE
ncbi:MAG: ABC transporter permease [Muribaculaceae bacterium]|nr:ABC transporter permease [Muribaculaceae bacterium]